MCFLIYGFLSIKDINQLIILVLFLNRILSIFNQIQASLYKMETNYSALNVINENIKVWKGNNYFLGKKIIEDFKSFKLKNVQIKAGKKIIFDRLNLSLPTKKMYKITGKSGVGKTFFIESLLGLREVSNGKINLDDYELDKNKINFGKWFSDIGYISNSPIFFNDSLYENIILEDTKIKKKSVSFYLEKLGLKEKIDSFDDPENIKLTSKNSNFSLGQSQRIQIIRGILHSKKILFIDEGISNVEKEMTEKILKIISKLKNKITIFVISHHFSKNKYFDYHLDVSENSIKLRKLNN